MSTEPFRHVPYDIEVEQALLGALIVDNSAIDKVSPILDEEHFFDGLHARLYEMIVQLQTEGEVSPLIIHACMKADPALQEVGGHAYLAGLAQAAPAMPNVVGYAKILVDLAMRRRCIRIGEDLVNGAYAAPQELKTATLADNTLDALQAVLSGTRVGAKRPSVQGTIALYEMLRRIEQQAVAERPHGVKTDIDVIDDIIGGLYPGKLIVAAGRPGMGKSILATNIGRAVAQRTVGSGTADERLIGIPVDYLSGEMDNDEISARFGCDIDYDRCAADRLEPLEYGAFTQMRATSSDVMRLAEANLQLQQMDFEIFDVSGMTLEWIEANCRRRSRKQPGHRLVIIDHLQLVDWAGARRGANRVEIQTEITKRLKALTKELGITILLLSQLSREVEKREDKHPIISDLREGGSIEQDADIVILIMRPLVYAKEKIKAARTAEARDKAVLEYDNAKGVLEVAIPKNRGGASADYRRTFIEPKASAIRNSTTPDKYDAAELPF